MGIITKIEQQKNKNRVNIFVDSSFFCGLEKETAVSLRLKEGREVDEKTLTEAIKMSEEKRAFEKAMTYISVRMHSKYEIIKKLKNKGFDMQAISGAVAKLEEYKFVNDDNFARLFIEQNNKLSKNVLYSKLLSKGIEKGIIEYNLNEKSDESELDNCIAVTKKLYKSSKINSYNDLQKLIAKIVRRGYSISDAKKAISVLEIKIDNFSDDFGDYDEF